MFIRKFTGFNGEECEEMNYFHLLMHGKHYHLKLREKGYYDNPKRWRRRIFDEKNVDIDFLVDMEQYTINKSVLKMLYPEVNPDLVELMLKEHCFALARDPSALYHGSQGSSFWENPKSGLANLSVKYKEPYTEEEIDIILNMVL